MVSYYLARNGLMREAVSIIDELLAGSINIPEGQAETRLWALLAAIQGLAFRDSEGAICSNYSTGLCPFI